MRALACPHRPPCPGCPRFGERGADPAALSRLDALADSAGVPRPRVIQGAPAGFRHRVRLAVRGRAHNPKIGLFELGSHRVVHIPSCVVHHPRINEVARALRTAMVETGVPPYSDSAHAGRVRYVQVVIERDSERAQVVLVTNDERPDGLAPLFERLVTSLGPALHSLHWNGNPERTNSILGPHWRCVHGPEHLVESGSGVRLFYPPGAFGQSNLPLADRLIERVRGLVPNGARIVELYAGVGALGLPLAAAAASLDLNELGADSFRGLERGRDALAPEVAGRVRLHPGPAAEHTGLLAGAEVVLVDPPRRGLDRPVLEALVATPPERLIYVSCGLDSFVEQCAALRDAGKLELEGLELYLMFPYTEHVETLAWFRRPPALT